MPPRNVVITGAGPGNGLSIARRFSAAGDRVCLMARSESRVQALATEVGGDATGLACDVTDRASVDWAFDAAEAAHGPTDVLIYNAGSGVFGAFDAVDADQFRAAWEVNALGLLHCAQRAAPAMRERGSGHIIVIGATASLRGGADFAAFASAKAAQRALAESLARKLGPDGVHVALVVIDGVIDSPRTRQLLPERRAEQFMQADDIAQTVHFLSTQPPSAWSFLVDLRPSCERW